MGHPPPTHHPTTFNHQGGGWQQSAFSKNVSGWSPKPIQHKNDQVDSENKNNGESNMIVEKVIEKPKPFRQVSQSGQAEIKIEYLYPIPNTYNLVLNGAWHCSTMGLVFP